MSELGSCPYFVTVAVMWIPGYPWVVLIDLDTTELEVTTGSDFGGAAGHLPP